MLGQFDGVTLYDDFAHHPTAIKTTLDGFRSSLDESDDKGRLHCIIEARSNTMKMGYHQNSLAASLESADRVVWYRSDATRLDLDAIGAASGTDFYHYPSVDEIIEDVVVQARPGDHVVIMSNGGFEGLHQKLGQALDDRKS